MDRQTFGALTTYMEGCMTDLAHDREHVYRVLYGALAIAEAGAEKAYRFLLEQGFPEAQSERVRTCIRTHRFRKRRVPESLEAKILFDADKPDAAVSFYESLSREVNGTYERGTERLAALLGRSEEGSV